MYVYCSTQCEETCKFAVLFTVSLKKMIPVILGPIMMYQTTTFSNYFILHGSHKDSQQLISWNFVTLHNQTESGFICKPCDVKYSQ